MSEQASLQARSLAFDGDSLWVGTSVGIAVHLERPALGTLPIPRRYLVGESTPIHLLAVSKDNRELALANDYGRIWTLQANRGHCELAFDAGLGVASMAWQNTDLVFADIRRKVRRTTRGPEDRWVEPSMSQGNLIMGPHWAGKSVGADALALRPDGTLALLDALAFGICEPENLVVKAWHQPIDGMHLVYPDGLVGLNAKGTHAFMHWDDFLIFDMASGLQTHEGLVEPNATCLALSYDATISCIGLSTGDLAVRDHATGRVTSLHPSAFPLAEIVANDAGSMWAWRDVEGGFGMVDSAGREVLSRKWATEILLKL